MRIEKNSITEYNQTLLSAHKRRFDFAAENISNVESIIQHLVAFNVAIPSWALGTGGTEVWPIPRWWRTSFARTKNRRCWFVACIKSIERSYFIAYTLGHS
jgi:L-rhamnose isomerase